MNRNVVIGIIVAAVIISIVGYAIGPYFTESSIDEALPDNVLVPPTVSEMEGEMTEMEGEMMEEMEGEMMEEMEGEMMEEMEGEMTEMEDAGETAENIEIETTAELEDAGETIAELEDIDAVEETGEGGQTEGVTQEVLPVTYSGTFVGVNDGVHNAEGMTRVLPLDDGSQILRLEDFHSTNGPDLYVYLSTDDKASDFVNLGDLKANSGNQNYEIPQGTDLEKYDKVLIWCKAFSVLFGSSVITADG